MTIPFDGMFDEITNEIIIESGELTCVSYDIGASNIPLLWGIHMTDYVSRDVLSINISNIFGNDYGEFEITEPILFEALDIVQSDRLDFEIKNIGPRTVNVIVMFSEYPENSDELFNTDSPLMNMMVPFLVSGFLLILGIMVMIIGTLVVLVDLKNNLDNKRNY